MVSKRRFREILDEVMPPEWTGEEPLEPDTWYNRNDPRVLAHQAREEEKTNNSKYVSQVVNDLERSKKITQVVGAEWKFTDETLDDYKKRVYGT